MEKWKELYEKTYISTCKIEKVLGLVKDSVRQKARRLYSDAYRKERERNVRGWPADNPVWIALYENTDMTHEDISTLTGMTVKQLFRRISERYPSDIRLGRNYTTKCIAQTDKQRRIRESATTIPSGSTAKRLEAVSP